MVCAHAWMTVAASGLQEQEEAEIIEICVYSRVDLPFLSFVRALVLANYDAVLCAQEHCHLSIHPSRAANWVS